MGIMAYLINRGGYHNNRSGDDEMNVIKRKLLIAWYKYLLTVPQTNLGGLKWCVSNLIIGLYCTGNILMMGGVI